MNKLTQAVIMLLLGGSILKATITDVFLRYVKAGLRPYLLVAGVLLVAAAVMTIWFELRSGATAPAGPDEHKRPDEHDAHEADGHGHDHDHHEPRVGWLLILPVIALLLITPPALGSYA